MRKTGTALFSSYFKSVFVYFDATVFSVPAAHMTEAELQTESEVIYDDVPREDPLSPDEGQ